MYDFTNQINFYIPKVTSVPGREANPNNRRLRYAHLPRSVRMPTNDENVN